MKDTNDIKEILNDIAESWGYDSFADYFATGLSENQVRIEVLRQFAEMIRSYSQDK